MTALINRPGDELIVSTPDETRRAVCEALSHVGMTYDELELQAKTGYFVSFAARLAWVAVRDLREFAV